VIHELDDTPTPTSTSTRERERERERERGKTRTHSRGGVDDATCASHTGKRAGARDTIDTAIETHRRCAPLSQTLPIPVQRRRHVHLERQRGGGRGRAVVLALNDDEERLQPLSQRRDV
jgi:hypothetical protein